MAGQGPKNFDRSWSAELSVSPAYFWRKKRPLVAWRVALRCQDLPNLRPLAREAAVELVEVGRRLAAAVDWRCSQVRSFNDFGTSFDGIFKHFYIFVQSNHIQSVSVV